MPNVFMPRNHIQIFIKLGIEIIKSGILLVVPEVVLRIIINKNRKNDSSHLVIQTIRKVPVIS
ncbi:hypothetical protein MA16_Dca004561 [Dendrobium catenatum]|uniref:Uncharacterized protein n=1 Tax=Dendrobium catenatum TaxID=906689 RepID=A0A2I0VNG3_9ASPA|nr:hypothetical protein MA16_Dca004561 [Dendrobium catenatum]